MGCCDERHLVFRDGRRKMTELPDFHADELAQIMAGRYPGAAYTVLAWTEIAHVGWQCDYAAVAVQPGQEEPTIVILGTVIAGARPQTPEQMLRDKIDELVATTEQLPSRFAPAEFGRPPDR
jgi:hypothetical protein